MNKTVDIQKSQPMNTAWKCVVLCNIAQDNIGGPGNSSWVSGATWIPVSFYCPVSGSAWIYEQMKFSNQDNKTSVEQGSVFAVSSKMQRPADKCRSDMAWDPSSGLAGSDPSHSIPTSFCILSGSPGNPCYGGNAHTGLWESTGRTRSPGETQPLPTEATDGVWRCQL